MYQGIKLPQQPQRQFLGTHPKAGTKLTAFERAHLKAYLAGHENFTLRGNRYNVCQKLKSKDND